MGFCKRLKVVASKIESDSGLSKLIDNNGRSSHKKGATMKNWGRLIMRFVFFCGVIVACLAGVGVPNAAAVDGTMTCSAVYCHSDGTSVSTGVVPSFVSPVWTVPGPLACNSCHGYPPAYEQDNPKSNEHFKHGHQTHPCSDCHYTTTNDGAHITDMTKHANRVYDVAPDPTVGNAFAYTWAKGGGTCRSVMCHGLGHADGVTWGDEHCYYTITSSPGAICFEEKFSLIEGQYNTCRLPGVSYLWSFGDGQTSTEAEPSHTYASAGTYSINLNMLDADSHPSSTITIAVIVASVNVPPLTDMSISVSGYTATLTDLSSDSDYNQCNHSGAGFITILWGNGAARTDQSINLTDVPSNQVYSYTYPTTATTRLVSHYVKDNANTGAASLSSKTQIKVPAPAEGISISGRLTRVSDGAPLYNKIVWLKINGSNFLYATTNPQGYYRFFSVDPACYTVEPAAISGYTFNPAISTPICTSSSDVSFTVVTP